MKGNGRGSRGSSTYSVPFRSSSPTAEGGRKVEAVEAVEADGTGSSIR